MATIRSERPDDKRVIHAIHTACFPTPGEAQLVDRLRAAGRLPVSLVAEVEGAVVGHVAFSPVTTPLGAEGVGLAPVAVLKDHRRQGIATALIQAGLAACRAAGYGWAVVLGDPAFYARLGFLPAAEFGLADDYGGGDAFQAIGLSPGGLPIGAGLVRYAPEFSDLA